MAAGKRNPNPKGTTKKGGETAKKTKATTEAAPKREANAQERNAQTLVKVRKKMIQDCAKAMRDIGKRRAELNEEAGEIRTRLKNSDINVPAFMAALRVADMEDETARDAFIGGLQETWEHLGVGGQLDMISALEKADAKAEKDDFEEDATAARPVYLGEAVGNA